MDALRRSLSSHQALNDSWRPIATLTPAQFNGFRVAFGKASGFQSAMYRQMEFLLGDKSRSMVRLHRRHPGVCAKLEESLAQPSLYDEVLNYLSRRGLPVPEHGPEDEEAPLAQFTDYAAVHRDADFVSLPGTGHYTLIEPGSEASRAVIDILTRLSRAEGSLW
jgi:tryptophan 2,3-dioxygenase